MSIISISDVDVSKITSGQVIVDLTSVVKELVDNAIDSGCDKLEITFNNHGSKQVEVSDNGSGIDISDFENLCLKHHTSKLTTFEDLSSVATLGFRGEAMSSLCAVAKVKVTTCSSKTFPRGTQLEYDSMGKLASKKTIVSGKKGTSVTVSDLFNGMPVRQKNFVKHIKREYTKTLSLLQAYLLAYTSIRFTVFNISGATGKKSMVMGTQGGQSEVTGVLTTIYGSNGAYGLIPVNINVKDLDARFKINSSMVPMALDVCLTGVLSDCSFGMGRAATDRQYFTINNRPVTHKKITKIINEVYKSFNTTQSPVFVLDLQLDTSLIDVNITPDKRSIMMQCEDVVCEVIREELVLLYEGRNNFVPKSQVGIVSMGSQPVVPQHDSLKRFRSFSDPLTDSQTTPAKKRVVDVTEEVIAETQPNSSFDVTRIILEESQQIGDPEEEDEPVFVDSQRKTRHIALDSQKHSEEADVVDKSESEGDSDEDPGDDFEDVDPDNLTFSSPVKNPQARSEDAYEITQIDSIREEPHSLFVSDLDYASMELPNQDDESFPSFFGAPTQEGQSERKSPDTRGTADENSGAESYYSSKSFAEDEAHHQTPNPNSPMEKEPEAEKVQANPSPRVNSSDIADHLQGIQIPLKMTLGRPGGHVLETTSTQSAPDSLASIQDISEAMEIRKEDFTKMEIVGQFNSGFIIVTYENKLFIVDQHASDEIFNYEKKMKELRFKPQPLVAPQILELSPIDEMKILDFADILGENGFAIEEIEGATPGRRVKLVGIPISRNIVFDVSDLHELVHKLHEQGASLGTRSSRNKGELGTKKRSTLSACRCTKVDRMIASRACRSSIMIGQVLSKQTMSKVVKNLAALDRPWNCPHGRPTMRHLADIQGAGFSMDYEL